ncbi:MAG: glycosyltransferase [Candidatus Sumerlaeia bacterium]
MAPKTKVLYLIERLARAGTELHLLRLMERLDKDRFEVVLCCLSEKMTDSSLIPEGVRCHLLNAGWNLLRPGSIPLFFKLRRIIRDESPDILHSFLFVSNVLAPFAVSRRHVKGVVISRGRMGIEWQAGRLHRFLQIKADHRADVITCKTEAMRREIAQVEKTSFDKVRVVPNGVDLKYFQFQAGRVGESRKALEKDYGISAEGPMLLAVGNLKPIKGHQYLIKATKELILHMPRVQVAILGDGESREELEQAIKSNGLESNVHLPGAVDDVRPWLRAADLFVAPSLSEGLPNAMLEAMAMGLPLVLSRIPGHEEVARTEAWYFEAGDALNLSEVLREALESPQKRAEMGTAMAQRAREEYSVAAMIQKMENIYTELLLQNIGLEGGAK